MGMLKLVLVKNSILLALCNQTCVIQLFVR